MSWFLWFAYTILGTALFIISDWRLLNDLERMMFIVAGCVDAIWFFVNIGAGKVVGALLEGLGDVIGSVLD